MKLYEIKYLYNSNKIYLYGYYNDNRSYYSALALRKYEYIENILLNKNRILVNECFCLLVAE